MSTARTVPLGDVARFVGGGTPRRNSAEYFDGGIPWVTPKDMKEWRITGSQVTLSERGVEESAARLVPAGSVLVVIRSGVLKHTLPVALAAVPVTVNQDMKALQCAPVVDPTYVARFLRASSARILSTVRATTADNIPLDVLKSLPIPIPPLVEQRRIADLLDRADALRAKRREVIAKL